MAKAPTPTVVSTAQSPTASPFQVRFGDAPAAIERKIGGGETSPFAKVMRDMPAPASGKFANFFVPAPEPAATITDATERAKATKDNSRKLANTLSGLSRRITKKDPSKAFVLRTVEEGGKVGICVYRVEPTPVASPAAPVADA